MQYSHQSNMYVFAASVVNYVNIRTPTYINTTILDCTWVAKNINKWRKAAQIT